MRRPDIATRNPALAPTTRRSSGVLGQSAVLAVVLLSSEPADAHTIGLSSGEYTATPDGLRVKLSFARAEAASLVPSLDGNGDGHVTAQEMFAARPELERKILDRIDVRRAGEACSPTLTDASLTEQDGLALAGRFACAAHGVAPPIDVDLPVLGDLAAGHRHVARAVGKTTHDEVLFAGHSSFRVEVGDVTEQAGPQRTTNAPATRTKDDGDRAPSDRAPFEGGFGSFFRMGIEHILTGYDHLVFLLGLVLVRAGARQLVGIVTAFTVGHSISLALAVTGVLTPSPRLVEPAIALSIAYVGIENFFTEDASKRWRITFPFGLVHGFGFAGALQEISLSRAQVPVALVGFNLGVETGQLAVLAVLLPLVFLARRGRWFDPLGRRVLSGAVAVAGGIWFVGRVVSGG